MTMSNLPDEKYYSVPAAAAELRISDQTLYTAIKEGKLKSMQVPAGSGGVRYVHKIAETDLLNWFENRKALKTQIVGVTELTVEDLADELLKRIKHAYNEGYKDGVKHAKTELMSAMKGVKL